MLLLLGTVLSPSALAAPAGFEELRTWNDCTLYKRDKTAVRPAAMRAECTWEDVDSTTLAKRLADFDGYDDLIWAIDASEVRRVDEQGRALVYQLQKIPFINDREVLLWAETEPIEGGVIARWTTATEEPLVARKNTVRTPQNQGFWRVEPAEKGSKVVHEIEIDAGGMPLPGWLMRAIRTRGFGRLLDEVHASVAG